MMMHKVIGEVKTCEVCRIGSNKIKYTTDSEDNSQRQHHAFRIKAKTYNIKIVEKTN